MVFNVELRKDMSKEKAIKLLSDFTNYCKENGIGLCGKCTKRTIEKCFNEGEGITVDNKFTGIFNTVGELRMIECTAFEEVE